MPESSQKFIARNRAPRVQIEYDLEVWLARRRFRSFIMGVMADLSGKPAEPLPGVVDLQSIDDFDERLKAMAAPPFRVPNTLTGR
ncbi:MAG: type VI secretion system contractile sheath small subunit [Rhodospirillales bacterium]